MAAQRQSVVMPLGTTSSLSSRSPPPTEIRQIPVTVLNGEPMCTQEDEAAKQELKETERQAWFQNEVNDKLDIPNGYLKVNVLIIRWHEDIDEFEGHDKEIERLEKIFRERFHYGCEIARLGNSKNPQIDLNLAILQHIQKHSGPDNLLIIYYTGHGGVIHDEDGGQRLQLSASKNLDKRRGSYIPMAFWDQAEAPLRDLAAGDVLSILDCCFASSAALKSSHEELRTYQLLAASSPNNTTSCPGKTSFTTALMDSLEELLDEHKNKSFPVMKLWERINMKRKVTASLIWDRLRKYKRTLHLAPLDVGPTSMEKREKEFQCGHSEKASLTLRFSLKADNLSQEQIESLARHLPLACRGSEIQICRIDWIKMETSQRPISFLAVATAFSLVRKRIDIRRNGMAEQQRDSATRKRSQSDELSPSGPSKRRSSLTPVSPKSMAATEESSSSS